jgi:hypothetical protein
MTEPTFHNDIGCPAGLPDSRFPNESAILLRWVIIVPIALREPSASLDPVVECSHVFWVSNRSENVRHVINEVLPILDMNASELSREASEEMEVADCAMG